jgi:hypothetical protein
VEDKDQGDDEDAAAVLVAEEAEAGRGLLHACGTHVVLQVHALPDTLTLDLPAGSALCHPINMSPDTWRTTPTAAAPP